MAFIFLGDTRMRVLSFVFLLALAAGFLSPGAQTSAAEPPPQVRIQLGSPPPQPSVPPPVGLAAAYPGDQGLADDPAVLLFESFDDETLDTVLARWDEASNKNGRVLELVDDFPEAATSSTRNRPQRSLQLTAHPGEDTGGHLYKRLPGEGVDELYLRFYVKFPAPANYIHHFVHVGGYHPSTAYPQGGAGDRPAGNERVTVGIEPFGRSGTIPAPGEWNLYAYWHQMKQSADGRFWGNGLSPALPKRVPVDRWQCVELRFKLNQPGNPDGALALWLDGKPAADFQLGAERGPWTGLGFQLRDRSLGESGQPFEGFDFRTSENLKLNFVWLLHYVTPENQKRNKVDDPRRPSIVCFDQVVAATRYIGPIEPPSSKQ